MRPIPMRKLWLNQNSFLSLSKKFIIKYLRQVPEDNENYRYDKNELYLYKPVPNDDNQGLYRLAEDLNEEISESDGECIILEKYFGRELSIDSFSGDVRDYEVHFHVSFIANDDENFIKFLEDNPIEGLNVVEIPYDHKYRILEDGVLGHQLLVHGKDFNIS